MIHADRPATRLATRLAFLVAGFGIACWAPLVPIVKQQLQIDEGVLGVLLLCLGTGAIVAMLLTGILSARFGSKPIIIAGGLGLALMLPILTLVPSPLLLGVALFIFGTSLGAIDVAMNIHAVEVERAAGKPLMSGFHALFSVGGFLGAGIMTLLLMVSVNVVLSCLLCAFFILIGILFAWPRLITHTPSDATNAVKDPSLAIPRGPVIILAVLAFVMFLVEGAILDWSALLIVSKELVEKTQGGIGYMLFAIAMTAGRFAGDSISIKLGDKNVLLWGGAIALSGFAVLLLVPVASLALGGFLLIGIGASNIVPVLFRRAGTQAVMSPGMAVAAISTFGYAGLLVGPAGIGAVAKVFSLPVSFWIIAILLAFIPLLANKVTR